MDLARRAFLATPLVFGLRELLAQDPKWEPDWFRKARERMARTNRSGVVLVVPDGQPEREQLGNALQTLLETPSEGLRELFCEAVFVCVTSEVARACLREPGERQNRFLLDPQGRRLAADTVDPEIYLDGQKFLKSFVPLVHGEKGERLRERAAAIREKLEVGVKKALGRLDAETVDERDEAAALVQKNAETILPLLVETRVVTANEEVRARCRAIVQKHFETAAAPGPRLPYGTRLEDPVVKDSCTGCGLVVVRREPRKLLRFLTK